MDNHRFDEHDVEEILQNMPKISDHRNSTEIYRGVQIKMNKKHNNRKFFLIPALSLLAAVILIVLITPVFLHKNTQESKSYKNALHKDIASGSATQQTNTNLEQSSNTAKANSYSENSKTLDGFNKTAIYEKDVKGNNVLTYGVFTSDAVVVPVSVLTPKDGEDWATQYKTTADLFPEKMKNVDNYLPIHGDLKYDTVSKKVTIIIPKSSISSITEQIQSNLNRIVQYSFAYQDVSSVDFTDESGNPIDIGELGQVESVDIDKTPKTPFYLYKSGSGEDYLLPNDNDYPNLQAALEAMKVKSDDFHLAVIQKDITFKVTEESNQQAIIQFTNNFNLANIDNPMFMIEGILLTAKNFGYTSVQFTNIAPLKWNSFDFSKPVNVPLAPNRVNLN